VRRALAFAVLCALFAGCSKTSATPGPTGEHPWTKPGVLRIGIQFEPKNLNTLLASNSTDNMIERLIFDPLLSADPKGNPVPVLATEVPTLENGGISKDGLTITYHLRKGVQFTDGAPLTSEDVKFSWQAMMNDNNNVVSRHGYDEVKSIDTPDASTVVVHLKKKFAPFVNSFFAESDSPVNIVPAHLLAKFPDVNHVLFNNEPIGSGPFKLSEWVKGDHITLVANNNYFRGKPTLQQIIISIIPDENTTLSQLRSHEIDWMFEPSYGTFPALRSIPDVATPQNDVNGYESLQINTSHFPLNDVQVRRALSYTIDKKKLLDSLTFGQETIATADLPDWMWAYNKNVTVYPHDPNKAKQILFADGWKPGAGGILTKNGQQLSLLLVTNVGNATRRKATVLLQSMLREVGIDVQLKYFDGATLFAPAPLGILQAGKFDLSLGGFNSGIDPDDSSNYVGANIPPGGYNYTRYDSNAMNASQQVALENYDRPTRTKAYANVEKLLSNDVPEIFFWWNRQTQAINPDLKNFDPNPVTESWNAYQWSI